MVNVGIASDEQNVALIPTKLIHLSTSSGQERRDTKTLGPEWAIAGDWFCRRGDGHRGRDNSGHGKHLNGIAPQGAHFPLKRRVTPAPAVAIA